MQKIKQLISLLLLSTALSACSIIHSYRPDVQQGNTINWQNVAKLKVGMTKAQATQIMGSPVLQNLFADNRMTYVYTLWPNHGPTQRAAVILTFRNDRLIKIEKQAMQLSDS